MEELEFQAGPSSCQHMQNVKLSNCALLQVKRADNIMVC
jgi:hypothetical protein